MATLWLLGGSPTNYGGSKNNRSTQHIVRLHHCDGHATTWTDRGSIFVRSSSSYIMFCSVQVCELMISSFKYLATKGAQRSASGYQSSGVVSASTNALGNEEFLFSRLVSSVANGKREEVGAEQRRGTERAVPCVLTKEGQKQSTKTVPAYLHAKGGVGCGAYTTMQHPGCVDDPPLPTTPAFVGRTETVTTVGCSLVIVKLDCSKVFPSTNILPPSNIRS